LAKTPGTYTLSTTARAVGIPQNHQRHITGCTNWGHRTHRGSKVRTSPPIPSPDRSETPWSNHIH